MSPGHIRWPTVSVLVLRHATSHCGGSFGLFESASVLQSDLRACLMTHVPSVRNCISVCLLRICIMHVSNAHLLCITALGESYFCMHLRCDLVCVCVFVCACVCVMATHLLCCCIS